MSNNGENSKMAKMKAAAAKISWRRNGESSGVRLIGVMAMSAS
jgi:ribosomal protein S8E